jgi:hypothetical protein
MSDFVSHAHATLETGNGPDAALLLTEGDLDGVATDLLERLVRLAIDSGEIGGFYPRIIGLVSPELQAEMNAAVGGSPEPEIVINVMRDDASAPHRDAIMAAFVKSGVGDSVASVFAETAALVSDEVRASMVALLAGSRTNTDELMNVIANDGSSPYLLEIAAAIAEDGDWDAYELAWVVEKVGHCLDDDSIVLIARAMQNKAREEVDEAPDDGA